jgi:hypothetical protein
MTILSKKKEPMTARVSAHHTFTVWLSCSYSIVRAIEVRPWRCRVSSSLKLSSMTINVRVFVWRWADHKVTAYTGVLGTNTIRGKDISLHLFCVCVILRSYRLCAGPIGHPRSPTKFLQTRSGNSEKRELLVCHAIQDDDVAFNLRRRHYYAHVTFSFQNYALGQMKSSERSIILVHRIHSYTLRRNWRQCGIRLV